ncbi:response regulator [Sphingobacterium sp. HJSM2_6]|uniref:response regulator n=1 Tax=Sphingobacterium sp. HJSM2_6 TaxID=3366264 RepID=UPI003BC2E1D0
MKYLCLILLNFILLNPLIGQKQLEFEYLTNDDGLSSGAISSIYQDKKGTIWFGTWDGLNVYNGREIKIYKSIPNDPTTLTNNLIKGITEGLSANEIWVTTFRGVNRLNSESGKIDQFYFGYESINPPHYSAFFTVKAKDNIYCALYNSSLYHYNPVENNFDSLGRVFDNKEVTSIFSDGGENFLIQCDKKELYRYVPKVNNDGTHSIGDAYRVLENINVGFIFQKDESTYWVVDHQYNLYLYESKVNRLTAIVSLSTINLGDISSIIQKEGDIYVASSRNGIWKYSYNNNQLEILKGIEAQWILSMHYCSKQNILWLGSNGNGVIKIYPNNLLFNSFLNKDLLRYFKKSQIRSIYEHKNGDIWIGSRGDGVSVISGINTDHQRITHVDLLSKQSIMSIVKGEGDDILLGTEEGEIYLYKQNKIHKINLNEHIGAHEIDGIYCMYWDSKRSVLWSGTNGKGLIRFDVVPNATSYRVKSARRYHFSANNPEGINNDNCFSILPLNSTHLWIATRGGGVNLMDIESETFLAINKKNKVSLSDDDVLSLYKSKGNSIWIGTSYGLNRLSYDSFDKMSIKHYTLIDGLLNHTIHGVVEDDDGFVWVSTNKGITKLDPKNGKIVNYSNGYGLQSNEFSDLAYLKASNGVIYFGGINGINYFKPSQVSERKFVPQIAISSLMINNVASTLGNKKKTIDHEEVLWLRHNENFFNISFAALDFINNSNCEYMYILEGFNKSWVNLGTDNSAVFTNVPPGKYTLRIRSTNGDKVWVDNDFYQKIIIDVPWWGSWKAFILYVLLISGSAYVIYRIVNKRLKFRKTLFMERLEKKKQQQIHDARLQFFTNIAHEFITPLTLIYGPVERLLKLNKLDENSVKYLKVIKSNSERMQKLINELMEFRKIDTVHKELNLVIVDLEELTLYIVDNFKEYAEEMSISFNCTVDSSLREWVTDRNHFEKIIFNLISNAFKYTNMHGSIDLIYAKDPQGNLEIKIRNTGNGIKQSSLESIFDNFHILDDFENQVKKGVINRTGIGLALTKSLVKLLNGEISVFSEVNSFVIFQIQLPTLELIENKFQLDIQDVMRSDVECINPKNKLTILLVEDEYQIRDLIKDVLGNNFIVLEAENGVEALKVIKKKLPSLIISDIEMPKMNGLELLEELKANKFTNHIPVIFLSVKGSMEDQISGIEKGVEYFISKPFSPHHLEVVINQLLSTREYLKEYYNSSNLKPNEEPTAFITAENEEFIKKVTQIIEANLENEELNATFICNELYISRIQLYRKIKNILDLSPSDFIRKVKLRHAVNLLKSSSLTVQEIMFKSGFNNRAYFYSVFKKEYGIAPLNLRDKDFKSTLNNN